MKTVEFKFDIGQEVTIERLSGEINATGIVIKCGFDGGFSYLIQTKRGDIWFAEQFLTS